MVKLVDTLDLGSSALTGVQVRPLFPVLFKDEKTCEKVQKESHRCAGTMALAS